MKTAHFHLELVDGPVSRRWLQEPENIPMIPSLRCPQWLEGEEKGKVCQRKSGFRAAVLNYRLSHLPIERA
jgi:hypothetical protein